MHLTLRAARASIRSAHRELVFSRAIARFMHSPTKAVLGSHGVVNDLIYGWGNEGWSAHHEYLAACVDRALGTSGAILECGSGLSTVLLAIVAQKRGLALWSLEHLPIWAERVQGCLVQRRIYGVRIHVAPLRLYGDFEWYAAPLADMPRQFTLVVCDGPPSATCGGRYGLLPVMKDRLSDDCQILLDDASRAAEQTIAQRWAEEAPCQVSLHGDAKPYFQVRLDSHLLKVQAGMLGTTSGEVGANYMLRTTTVDANRQQLRP
jgi:hypothetical protein